MEWNFATAYELIADTIGDSPALICNDVIRSWSEYDERAARIASILTEAGLGPNSKAGIYLHNGNEYLEAHHGIFKLRGCPINVNYRYREEELVYLLNNADAEALIFQSAYAERIESIRDQLTNIRCFIQVQDESGTALIPGAVEYEAAIASASPMQRIDRKSDDTYMLYTGGTTGMPKGVMYANGDHCRGLQIGGTIVGGRPAESMEQLPAIVKQLAEAESLPKSLVCCPLMHGTGMWAGAMMTNLAGGAAITVGTLGLDAHQLLSEVEKHRASLMVIVGEAFAQPILKALDEKAGEQKPYDISSIKSIVSSGVMWSKENKTSLLAHHDMALIDMMGSTEGSMGSSVSTRKDSAATAKFKLGASVKVFNEEDVEVTAGSGEMGMLATKSAMMGYYKDPEKTAKTVRVIDGVRYVFPGDFATIEADGSITLLGRGSMCINTAGEKVFPEEVEEVIKRHDQVVDCLVVGVPDDRFGQRIVALVSSTTADLDATQLVDFCRDFLAGYKLPRDILLVETVQRAQNGKADYKWAKQAALDMLGLAEAT